MAQSKNVSKGTSKKKSIESNNSDKSSSGSTTMDKSVQSINASNILTINIEATDNKGKYLSSGSLNLLSSFIYSSFIDIM